MAVTTANPRDLLPNSIDMSTLSHSELHSLSLLSNSLPHSSSLDPVVGKINTSTFFNESAGSRRQTYFTTPHQPHHHRHRHVDSTFSERERSESVSIVNFFKRFLQSDGPDLATSSNASIEIVNRNGVVVDLAALEEAEEKGSGGPFAEELRRMAGGSEKEEDLLKVLAGMEGDWCSARKKRRIVAACLLGDALPVDWKVIIALRRKGGRFSPFCRTYISPTGEHLSSCKEVSSYLKSHFGINDTKLLRDSRGELQQLQRVDLENAPRVNSKDGTLMLEFSHASTPNTCLPLEHEKDYSVLAIDNLPDVNVCDLYECHTCNISFDVKDSYLQHVLSTHGRTTKRYKLDSSVADQVIVRTGHYKCRACSISFDVKEKYVEHRLSAHKKKTKRLGSSVGDGVIIRDGKYECQFCHKVFEERRRYLGHVGNHVKGSIKTTNDSGLQMSGTTNTPCPDQSVTKIDNLKMNALVEIAQSSAQEIIPLVPEKESCYTKNVDELYMAKNGKLRNADFDAGKNSGSRFDELDVERIGGAEHASSLQLKPCSKFPQTSHACPRETEKDNGKDETLFKEPLPPSSKASETTINDGGINNSLREMEKDSAEAKGSTSTKVLYSCYTRRQKPMTNGTRTGPASCPSGLVVEKDGRDVEMKEQSFTRNVEDLENDSCFDAMMMPAVETGIQPDNSNGNCGVKSTSTEDEGSAEDSDGGFDISFLTYNQKPSDMDSAGENIQSEYLDKHELAQRRDDSNLGTVDGDSSDFGFTMPQTLVNPSSPFDEIFEKAGQNICNLDPNLESETGFEYMKLDVIEPQMYKYDAMSGEDPIFLPEVSMGLEKDSGFDLGFNASANSQSQFPEAIASGGTTTMTCVWCGLEFSHEVMEVEPQPDSVGFMCPACRAKISKQFNDLESNFSVNPHYS